MFIPFFIIIVYYEVVIVLVTGDPGPVHSSVASVHGLAPLNANAEPVEFPADAI
jgi:hypothetical protein